MKLLSNILNNITAIQVTSSPENIEIISVDINSKDVKKGSLFFALKGYKTDGHKYIYDAINNGASAVILQDNDVVPDEFFKHANCVKILVTDSRYTLSAVSDFFYDSPSKKIKVIGITGTKGKSTTAFFVKHLLEKNGKKCGLIGTIANFVGDREIPTKLTTPEAFTIDQLLSEMIAEGCEYCVMEVSSHSLDLHRVSHIQFIAAVFTNITSDHLDFHETFENYKSAKLKLFGLLNEDSVAIVNKDDESVDDFITASNCRTLTFGENNTNDFVYSNLEYDLTYTSYDLENDGARYHVNSPLPGRFNLYNSGIAVAVVTALGYKFETNAEYVSMMPQVPGRFEVIYDRDRIVIVDYSHTSDSLRQALEAIEHINISNKPVFTVMGCGGDRDRTKRPVMGAIATSGSTHVIVTSDNPRTEDPFEIISEITDGIKSENYEVIENREAAIKSAVTKSPENAVVLIAGKGHETYQEIDGVRHHFSDKETALKYLINE
ncbi:MAG: UDP-N-acetylmuramoyl-L-alanyl-D-glutamate--2,6-diaminopimelate ligase 1 [Melioribacteraceae bacterium]|nr:MAG: UDP-N-acetylmuramoyl-L-alanyl-D-glutamate--2,6-diaminopimelate ligase 1 [Melioribacteraceae bacterium]